MRDAPFTTNIVQHYLRPVNVQQDYLQTSSQTETSHHEYHTILDTDLAESHRSHNGNAPPQQNGYEVPVLEAGASMRSRDEYQQNQYLEIIH